MEKVDNATPPNNAYSRLGVRAALFELFRGFEFSPFRQGVYAPTSSRLTLKVGHDDDFFL
jgi:hypothetical protein